jgi:uncharacterized metal-binding protein YceD (DUF177 family)
MTIDKYDIPADLQFKTKEIQRRNGLKAFTKLDVKSFADLAEKGTKLEDMSLSLKFSVGEKEILCEGKLCVRQTLECSRCLMPYKSEFCEEFGETFSISDPIIDIMYTIKNILVLSNETRHICNESCRGLCSQCGCNLNKTECNCGKSFSLHFADLKNRLSKRRKKT